MNTWKPVVSRKKYASGGQVDDLGGQVQSPQQKLARKQESVARAMNWSKGHVLTNSQKERQAADLAAVGSTIDYTPGGEVGGGPPGTDTVPVVEQPGGPAEAMLDNGEYVLPKNTTDLLGKPNLDNLVQQTTGQAPVGAGSLPQFGAGGFFDRFRNRGKQIDEAVDAATQVQAPAEPEPNTSMRDIMREIRKKNPPTKQKVRGYAAGGLMTERERIRARMQDAQPLPKLSAVAGRPRAGYSSSPHGAGLINLLLNDDALQKKQQGEWKRSRDTIPAPISEVAPSPESEPPLNVQPPVGDSEVPGAASLESVQPPAALAPQDSIIRRASPEEVGFGESVNLSNPKNVRTNSAAFSPENIARARSKAQMFEANNPLETARTVDDINADAAALRDLRRVRTNLADGRPANWQHSRFKDETVAPTATPKLSDLLGVANYERNIAKDRQATLQNINKNRRAEARENRERIEAANAQEDRYMEEAERLAPELTTQLPWMGTSTSSFFKQASEINADPMRAASTLSGTFQELRRLTDSTNPEEVLLTLTGPKDESIPITGADAVALLNGEKPIGSSWFGLVDFGSEFYETARRQAAAAVQAKALEELSK